MNPVSLDQTLRALTISEKKYKADSTINAFHHLNKIEHQGQLVYSMEFEANVTTQGYLFIKKQSRFVACQPHIHNWLEINYMYSGNCHQIINNTSYTLKKGQVVLIDSDTIHSTDILGEDDIMISLVIDKHFLNSNFFNRLSKDSILSTFFINTINHNTNHNNYIVFHSENSRTFQLYFNELLCEFYDPSINSTDIVNSLINLLFCELINVYEDDLEQQDLDMHKNSISPILRYIEGNYRTCSLESTAKFFNMNPNYMTTLLKNRTGHSYKDLIQKQRLIRAGQLLKNTNLSITEVANEVGYENISFFYKKFREHFLSSPKEYRLKG